MPKVGGGRGTIAPSPLYAYDHRGTGKDELRIDEKGDCRDVTHLKYQSLTGLNRRTQ